jgi:hypothetical protein
MDGVPMITQCPIQSETSFRYKFHATNPGTHFYHSHYGKQLGYVRFWQIKEEARGEICNTHGEIRNACNILIGKPEGKRKLE